MSQQGEPGIEIAGYRTLELLGRGGMGAVYRAADAAGRTVALKLLPFSEMTPRAVARLEREAELLARHRHPGIVAIHAWGKTERACWLACELVEGRHIDEAARELELPARLDLVEQLADAVGAAHAIGVVHRDLKPENVLVDAAGRVRVIDFGASTGEGVTRLTQTGQFVGTPLYMPPERLFGGKDPDSPAGDVWSLALIAWELFTGRTPYPMENAADLLRRNARPAGSPRDLEPRLPAGVADLLVRALDPDPVRRPQDGARFAAGLRAGRSGRAQRGRAPVALASGALLLTAGLLLAHAAPWSSQAAVPLASATPSPVPTSPTALPAEPQPDPARQRGEAALLAEPADLEVARAALGADDPLLQAELARAALGALDPGDEQRVVQAIDALITAAHRTPAATRAGAEVRRRAEAQIALALIRLAANAIVDLAEHAGTITAADRLREGPSAGLALVPLWFEWCQGCAIPGANSDDWLTRHQDAIPDLGEEADPAGRRHPELAALALAFRLAATKTRPSAIPRELALHAGPTLDVVSAELGIPGRLIAREASGAGIRKSHAEAWAALARGDRAAAEPWLAAGDAHLARIQVLAFRGPSSIEVWAGTSLALLRRDVATARDRATLKTPKGPREQTYRVCTDVECDLVAGDLAAATARLAALRPEDGLERLRARLALHCRALAGEVTAAEALGAIPPDDPDEVEWVVRFPWHTAGGLRQVLSGGWWPGKEE